MLLTVPGRVYPLSPVIAALALLGALVFQAVARPPGAQAADPVGVVVATVPLGGQPGAVAVNPVTNRIYVVNGGTLGHVAVVDGNTNEVVTTIPVGGGLRDIAVNSATNRIYVAMNGGVDQQGLAVIDGMTHTVTRVALDHQSGIDVYGIAVDETRNLVFVTTRLVDRVHVINGATNTKITHVGFPDTPRPNSIAVLPALNRIYVALEARSQASVIDVSNLAAMTEVGRVFIGSFPGPVAANPRTNRVYVTSSSGYSRSFDGLTLETQGDVGVAPYGSGDLAVHPGQNRIYIALAGGDRVGVVDGPTRSVLGSVIVGESPFNVAVSTLNGRVYASNAGNSTTSGSLSVIETVGLATATPTPTQTPLPTATSTPEPTATFTPVPTDTPTATPTSTPTNTPTSTATATASPTATSTVSQQLSGLRGQVETAASEAKVRNSGVERSLLAKLDSVERALARGDADGARRALDTFIAELDAQRGKGVEASVADALAAEARRIQQRLA